jgi:hypothetical protein
MKEEQEKIHVTKANMMPKGYLIYLIFGENDAFKYIDADIPDEFRGKIHHPSHVWDVRRKKPINLMQRGIENGILFETL